MPKSIFNRLLGNKAKIKVLEFLMKSPKTDFSISDIAKGAGIGRTTLFRIWNSLEETRMIKKTRIIGNAKLYALNIQNPIVEKLIAFYNEAYAAFSGAGKEEK